MSLTNFEQPFACWIIIVSSQFIVVFRSPKIQSAVVNMKAAINRLETFTILAIASYIHAQQRNTPKNVRDLFPVQHKKNVFF